MRPPWRIAGAGLAVMLGASLVVGAVRDAHRQQPATPGAHAASAGGATPTAGATPVAGAAAAPVAANARFAATALAPAAQANSAVGTTGSTGLGTGLTRKVEQNAAISLQVKDVASAFDAVTALATTFAGYVQTSNLNTSSQGAPASGTLVVAVPQARLGDFLQQVAGLGTVRSRSVSGQDVTQQYVDLQGRLTALQAERQSYLTLLGKATTMGDILQIQNALTDVETQIENVTGQIRMIDDLSAMARVSVTLAPIPVPAPKPKPKPVPGPLAKVLTALKASLHTLTDGATAVALAIAWALPWAALGTGGLYAYRRWARPRNLAPSPPSQ